MLSKICGGKWKVCTFKPRLQSGGRVAGCGLGDEQIISSEFGGAWARGEMDLTDFSGMDAAGGWG